MADNQFSVKVPSALEALMAGEQGFKEVSGAIKEQKLQATREEAAQSIMQGGNPQDALAKLLGIGDDKGAATLATVIHNQQTGDLAKAQLAQQGSQFATSSAETARHNTATEGQAGATLAETRRQHDIAEKKPVSVPAGASLVDPQTGTVKYAGSNGLSEAGNEIAARQIINGDLSALQNVGRGGQGDAKLTAIKNKAADILINENGMTPAEAAAHLGQKLQAFKASSVGASAEERTRGNREGNLNLILKATEAAIPAALEASDNVERYAGSFVPLNKIIQNGQIMTSDAPLRRFGMANLQLAEHWARAMNPTGVMRESDRDMALKFLSTADTKDTYRQVVDQLKTQITRERDAVRAGGGSSAAPAAAAPAAAQPGGAPAAPSVKWRMLPPAAQ